MANTMTVELPGDVTRMLRDAVAQGRFEDEGAMITEALRSFEDRTMRVEFDLSPDEIRGIREAADEMDRNPGSGIPIEDVMERFRSRRQEIARA